ncbi:plus-3-domain-containing protein [Schizopora paradoxa]|uniref:Plus-3-domain-containing protein n=1 Tax=Schizopora paradoxa TaxID=27342 RepID=A0A0H2S447_9AGAM|nr:plus-3-domain-containing protein [Schizopora paradoxa]
MSDSEGDFSDELLELAGATEKKRKSRPSSSKSSSKRRKADAQPDSDGEEEYESEEDDANPYPLEGKFVDEADRHKLMELPEVEREEILSQRMEEMQRLQDKRNLDQMHRAQRGESDNVSKAAKRVHAVRGATKEKSRKLDELKAKRKAKGDKKRSRPDSPKRDRSSSPMDMEMSDDEDEDGQISRFEQDEEREQRLLDKYQPEEMPFGTLRDLERLRISRDSLCKQSKRTWFEEFAKGGWVRYLVGQDDEGMVYRICEIQGLGPPLPKPYKIDGEYFDQQLQLRHGKSVRLFTMERVSNSPFTDREFRRLKSSYDVDNVKMPYKLHLDKKLEHMRYLLEKRITESDINAMLARKQSLHPSKMSATMSTLERSKIMQELNLARKRHDMPEITRLEEKLKAFNEATEGFEAKKEVDPLALVNERNRLANLEAVRRAEAENAKRRFRDRKAALAASRSGTPSLLKSSNATPKDSPLLLPTSGLESHNAPTRSVSPLPAAAMGNGTTKPQKRTFESMLVNEVEVDLGDF